MMVQGGNNGVTAQESMPVEKKLDYGIAWLRFKWYSNRHVVISYLKLDYYYGLGNVMEVQRKTILASLWLW